MWIADLARAWLAQRRGVRVHKGDRVRTLVDIRALGLVYFFAPFSSGFHCTIPRGAVLSIYAEPAEGDLGFNCTLVDPDLEKSLVPAMDRQNEKYAGHAFTFGLGDIGRRLELLPSSEALA